MHRFTFRHFLFLGAAWTLTGCAGELPSLKMSDIPALWEQKPDPLAPAWPDKEWWRGFASDELNNLIAQAQADNLDIAAAEARVLQADAQARVAG